MSGDETQTFIDNLKQQLANAPEGVDTSGLTDAIKKLADPGEEQVKIWFLLDLSLIHIRRCRRYAVCRSRWSPYH